MKRDKIAVLFAVFAWLFALNCGETPNQMETQPEMTQWTQPQQSKENFNNPYGYIGRMHNEALDAAFKALKKNKTRLNDTTTVLVIAQEAISQYFWNRHQLKLEKENFKHGCTTARQLFFVSKSENVLEKVKRVIKENNDFTPDQKVKSLELLEIDLTKADYKSRLNAFNKKIKKELPSDQAERILIMSAIKEYSHEYWKQHEQEWNQLFQEIRRGKSLGRISAVLWQELIEVDAISAGAALVPCLGATVGYLYCVAGAAIGGSLAYEIFHLISVHF